MSRTERKIEPRYRNVACNGTPLDTNRDNKKWFKPNKKFKKIRKKIRKAKEREAVHNLIEEKGEVVPNFPKEDTWLWN